ncbi:LAQU0S20e00518g1_1 [Lachancea quebecensis]|uniref:DASH complex subunit DAD2 n=1 Tax=Lachancea quebecensis TaxID=1654605 RepID=A0A0P1KXP3_9SACH|nr:LAQU0S20e00518g1_1 [Lachancea quebecensis]
MPLEDQIASKKRELEALKKINTLTKSMRLQLDDLAVEVKKMHENADNTANVMKNWDSIVRSISQASLSLLQYSEGDYEIGIWGQDQRRNDEREESENEPPLPETLVRVRVDNDESPST